ncbi:Hypothetical protein SCLAV_2266 [Streptomyces clavuligerus]|uniref:Uncharacterized protein n=1 Tax=Streptomyces clavuligerus TaxID=1901 RepID=E2Q7D3_STRCL|nr:Hypothetical protein SCLAV_2266 [Streptomyces clavuligerus]
MHGGDTGRLFMCADSDETLVACALPSSRTVAEPSPTRRPASTPHDAEADDAPAPEPEA